MSDAPEKTLNLRQFRQEMGRDTAIVPHGAARIPSRTDACLVCIAPSGPTLGRRYAVGQAPVAIGRDATCAIVIPDGGVSRNHARIELGTDGRFHIEDLNSTNGTWVNSSRLGTGILKDGDYVRIGECIFRFLAGGNIEAEYHEEIHRLAILDPLTGIHNRRYLMEFLDREIERAQRHARPLAVILLDIDHFKRLNDGFSHLAGDFVLKHLAARLRQRVRAEELLARYGGEEFALVLPETDLEGAVACAERFRRAVSDTPFEFEGHSHRVTVSAGIGVRPPGEPVTPADLLHAADVRLYEAKRGGRDRIAPSARIGVPSSRPATPPPTTFLPG